MTERASRTNQAVFSLPVAHMNAVGACRARKLGAICSPWWCNIDRYSHMNDSQIHFRREQILLFVLILYPHLGAIFSRLRDHFLCYIANSTRGVNLVCTFRTVMSGAASAWWSSWPHQTVPALWARLALAFSFQSTVTTPSPNRTFVLCGELSSRWAVMACEAGEWWSLDATSSCSANVIWH